MKEWTPNSRYGGHAFGFKGDASKKLSQFDEFLAGREKILPWIAEYSPYALVTPDDPPVYLIYSTPPALGKDQKDPTHTANFGVKLQENCREVGVECELVYPGAGREAPDDSVLPPREAQGSGQALKYLKWRFRKGHRALGRHPEVPRGISGSGSVSPSRDPSGRRTPLGMTPSAFLKQFLNRMVGAGTQIGPEKGEKEPEVLPSSRLSSAAYRAKSHRLRLPISP